ncbi:DUF6377 domain-containing protein [Bacteroides sp. 51]|uniref:DUF6377 domain-containing protein n=1 Tax=Bacteroides sp. 51 TaxID=2302938 RepID=UPI0013D1875D|nr:DUF6377 domain-containing protein [Bacteroides sp. 51]NDV84015.1 hypothetical protein [Bacteroides sp. 51]
MRHCLILFSIFLALSCYSKTKSDTVYVNFEKALANKDFYAQLKFNEIAEIRKLLSTPHINDQQRYDINHQLYDAYKIFIADSAIVYTKENVEIAQRLNDAHRLIGSQLDLIGLYTVSGLYIEALNGIRELEHLDKRKLPDWFSSYYYQINNQLYKSYSLLNDINGKEYLEKSILYRDSLLGVLDTNSNFYKIVYAEKLLDNKQIEQAQVLLEEMFGKSTSEDHEHAVLAHALANVYKAKGNIEEQKKYLLISAMSDIKNAIKENASMQMLASVLYEAGDIANAYKCIRSSMEDAMFCNARLRTFEVSKIFPIIDSAYKDSVDKQQRVLIIFLVAVSILSFLLIMAVIYVYKQMKRIARIRKELYHTNIKLKDLNDNLQNSNEKLSKLNLKLFDVNSELSEANQIKEAYIGHFLDLCSTYIDKIESYQNTLRKKAADKKLEELYKILKSREMIDNELKALYENFDNIFLHLYPNFVEDFNSLLLNEERFQLKANELLNAELRIFALIRLGITDSSKIAKFLHYSANTIYSYRTRVRNKSAVPREQFENMVMKIGIIKPD